MKKKLSIILIVTIIFVLISGCSSEHKSNDFTDTKKPNDQMTATTTKESTAAQTTEVPISNTDKFLKNMSLEEKVGQLFIMSIRNFDEYSRVIDMNDAVKKRIEENHLGGVILFGENIETISQTKRLIADIKASSKIPLFMAVDEEGGATSRINTSGNMHATMLPSNYVIGMAKDTDLAKRVGALIAEEIASLGFNMDFAPVADVNTNPLNPVIGERSFGDKPDLVAEMVKAEVKGMQEKGIIPVLKHFPGHGDTATDTHTGAVVIEHDKKRLNKIELFPFQAGINDGVDAIMTAHIQVPKITHNEMPSTLSKEILTDLLRKEMKFEGLIITDALEMGAISQRWGSAEASILAFEAGADILLMPKSIDEAYQGMLKAVKEGRITENRLEESVSRILKLKEKWGILDDKVSSLDPEKTLGSEEHQKVAREVIEKANKNK